MNQILFRKTVAIPVASKGLFIAVALFFSTAPAHTACRFGATNFYFTNDQQTIAVTCDASGGNYNYRTGSVIELTALNTITHPKNGKLAPRDGAGLEYRPKAGYRGPDAFTIRVCGTYRGQNGCSYLNYQVSVQ
ncbi:MAG: hypothetical protein ACRCXM_14220 [Beijerinckiaceae bacterium]